MTNSTINFISMNINKFHPRIIPVLLLVFACCYQDVEAQRMNHGASRGALNRPGGGGGGVQRNTAGDGNRSINGGSIKSPDRGIRNNQSSNRDRTKINNQNRSNNNT